LTNKKGKTLQNRTDADNSDREEAGAAKHMQASFLIEVSIPNKHRPLFLTDDQVTGFGTRSVSGDRYSFIPSFLILVLMNGH
jgi:hypothetical protein